MSVELMMFQYSAIGGINEKRKGKLGAYAMRRVAAGADLPTPWLFELAKRPGDRANYCLYYSFLP